MSARVIPGEIKQVAADLITSVMFEPLFTKTEEVGTGLWL